MSPSSLRRASRVPDPPTGSGDIGTDSAAAGQILDQSRPQFWAVIDAQPDAGLNAYGFTRVNDGTGDGTFPDLDGTTETSDGDTLGGNLIAWEVNGRTDVATDGTVKVQLTPNRLGRGYTFTAPGGGSAGFFARLTTSSSGKWKWVALTLDSGGAWQDDGSESATFSAVPSTVDGTNLANPAAGLRVWMVPSAQAGYYEFEPYGYADASNPGLVSDATQSFGGKKTFCATDLAHGSTVEVDPDQYNPGVTITPDAAPSADTYWYAQGLVSAIVFNAEDSVTGSTSQSSVSAHYQTPSVSVKVVPSGGSTGYGITAGGDVLAQTSSVIFWANDPVYNGYLTYGLFDPLQTGTDVLCYAFDNTSSPGQNVLWALGGVVAGGAFPNGGKVIAGSDGFGVHNGLGTTTMGFTGTSGGGDTVIGGIITAAGGGGTIDGGGP
jgi:hypothetical protein